MCVCARVREKVSENESGRKVDIARVKEIREREREKIVKSWELTK